MGEAGRSSENAEKLRRSGAFLIFFRETADRFPSLNNRKTVNALSLPAAAQEREAENTQPKKDRIGRRLRDDR